MIFLKRAVSPVVATALLLVVAVSAVVGFSGWFSEFNSNLFVDVESDSSSSSSVRVEGIFNDVLYLKSNSNQILEKISIIDNVGEVMCEIDLDSRVGIGGDSLLLLSFDNSSLNQSTNYSKDLSGSGFDIEGILAGSPTSTSLNCVSGDCFEYDGNQGLRNYVFNDGIKKELSIGAWVVPTNLLDRGGIVAKNQGGGYDNVYYISHEYDKFKFSLELVNGTRINLLSPIINENQTYFIVGTYDGRTTSLYLDGILVNSSSLDFNIEILNNSRSYMIGSESGRRFEGIIDEVFIYSKSINSLSVKMLFGIKKAVSYEQLLVNGINKIDLSSCNLNSNYAYNIVGFSEKNKIDVEVIPQ